MKTNSRISFLINWLAFFSSVKINLSSPVSKTEYKYIKQLDTCNQCLSYI